MKLLRLQKSDWYAAGIILLFSLLTVAELFLTPGRSANMDGIVHTITPNLFYLAMKNGEFPIGWVDGFANYGLPLGIIAHQLTTYATALLQFVVEDPVIAFNTLAFIGFFLSSLFFYCFLRIYFSPVASLTGVVLFNLAPYRILNIFIRGALPEFFAGIFVPLMLIGLYVLIERRNISGAFLFAFSICGTALTHPFMLIISMFLIIPYCAYLLVENKLMKISQLRRRANIKLFGILLLFVFIGVGMASYFVIPLLIEIKYFYYGLTKDHLTPNNFLSIKNFFDPNWYYFTETNILPRGFVVNVGLVETLIFLAGILLTIIFLLRKVTVEKAGFLYFSVTSGLLIIFFMTQYSEIFYKLIPGLSGIQFPWRLLSVYLFVPPMLLAFFLAKTKKIYIPLLLIAFVCTIRFPAIYGKNYVKYPESDYRFTPLNLHATVMNPIWTGRSEDYPIKKVKSEFIEGKGNIKIISHTNASRKYEIETNIPSRVVDYTFYFPGWKVYVDGALSPIEYQDPKYRGVITYALPAGRHTALLLFEDTRVRMAGKVLSIVSICIFASLYVFRKKLNAQIV